MQAIAFATALAAASAIFAVVLMLPRVVASRLFVIVFNRQFFGPDVASLLLPTAPSTKRLVPGAIIVIATAWVFGLIWALLYNRWA